MTNTSQAKVGDILSSSWGYDQTNVDFYIVTKVSPSGKTVTLAKLTTKICDSAAASDSHLVVAGDIDLDESLITRRVKAYNGSWGVDVESYEFARLWDGQPEHQTPAWAGH